MTPTTRLVCLCAVALGGVGPGAAVADTDPPPESVTHLSTARPASPAAADAAPAGTIHVGTPRRAAADMPPAVPGFDSSLVPVSARLGRYFGVTHGVLVLRVPPPWSAVLEEGDVVTAVAGHDIGGNEELVGLLAGLGPRTGLPATVERDHHRRDVWLPLALAPVEDAHPREPRPAAVPRSPGAPRP